MKRERGAWEKIGRKDAPSDPLSSSNTSVEVRDSGPQLVAEDAPHRCSAGVSPPSAAPFARTLGRRARERARKWLTPSQGAGGIICLYARVISHLPEGTATPFEVPAEEARGCASRRRPRRASAIIASGPCSNVNDEPGYFRHKLPVQPFQRE